MKHSVSLLVVSLLVLTAYVASDVDAIDSPEETWYCYGDVMTLQYPYDPTGLDIQWEVSGYHSGELIDQSYHSGVMVTVSVQQFDHVIVAQIVSEIGGTDSDTKTIDVIPLGLKNGETITVRFMDGTNQLSSYELDSSVSVMLGNRFVTIPDDPVKTNYRFTGWYTDQECTKKFDPFLPVFGNTTVYAGWTSAGSSSSIDVSGYVVTFNAAPGLNYQVVGTGDRAVSFTVSVMDGYRFDMDSIQASAGTTKISPVNGIYTLSGITKDTVIEIAGDRLYNVSYDMSNVSISSEDLGKDSLSVSFSPSFGWSGVSLKVIMGGADVTSQYVNGSSVDIDQLSGDVIIMAQADLPWIYVLVIVIIVAIALVAVLLARKRKVD